MSNIDLVENLNNSPGANKMIDQSGSIIEAENTKRVEFYNLIHENVHAEFINGEIVFQAPARFAHWITISNICGQLFPFVELNDLGLTGAYKVMIRLTRNDYEPDIVFFRKEKSDNFTPDQMFSPAPDFIIEIISPSTEKIDREIKFADYAAHGVGEYWIVDPEQQSVEQYLLENNRYQLKVKLQAEGIVHAKMIEEFALDVKSVFN